MLSITMTLSIRSADAVKITMAVAKADIGAVHAGARDPDEDIGGTQDRVCHIPHPKDVGIAEPVELDRLH
ncbi:hypothetical protein ACFSUK_29875 [Sphingobium scionense]|jgi:hypothetical protein|uniref:Uncharacterized protein n=1 Tax=Sphingobium scionense TaxID=1404341 RepID=A0A7W6LT63_9SPHN|nr:hypothetical protein [Sphingobium scionense]MBB4150035.1 hypothetical protein [Sphingobium scionense]